MLVEPHESGFHDGDRVLDPPMCEAGDPQGCFSPQARWLDFVVSELEGRGHTPLGKLIGFWEVMGEWAEGEQFRGCPYLNTLVEIRDPDHPAYSEVSSYIDEVETYLSRTALEAGIHDGPAVGRQLRVLAMGRGSRSCSRPQPVPW